MGESLLRAVAARGTYLGQDRMDVQFAAKECARGMSTPTQRDMSLLKRAARFTLEAPRTVWVWKRQGPVKTLTLHCDTG